jgi:hypothetical protein
MKTRDGIEFIPGTTLYEPYRRADGEWYIAAYTRTAERMEYWREYAPRCFFYWEAAVNDVIVKMEAEAAEAARRTRHRIVLWRESQHAEHRRFNVTEH